MDKFSCDNKDYYQQNFTDLKLSGRKIDSIVFEECFFEHCDFNETLFKSCRFVDCHFLECNLSVAKITYCRLNDVIFENCKAIGIDWTQADWPGIMPFSPIRFLNCMINDSSFLGLNLEKLSMQGCEAHDVDFREGRFCGSNFKNTDFANSLFNNTDLSFADFTQAMNYRIDLNHNKIHNAKFSRYEAVCLLESLDIELVD